MAPTTTPINFKLHLAPGAVEKFTITLTNRAFDEFIDNLELKLGELGLTFDVVFWKNDKGNLISLAQNARKMLRSHENSNLISIYAIANSTENSSDSSSGESGDELIVIDSSPEMHRRRHRWGRRDRSRSRSHSRDRHGARGPKGRCGRERFACLERRVELLEAESARRDRPRFGRRARSASPPSRGPPGFHMPFFKRGFRHFGDNGPHGPHGPRGPHGPHGHGPHGPHGHGHHMGPFGRGIRIGFGEDHRQLFGFGRRC